MNEITIEMRRETVEDIVSAIRERAGIGFDMGRPEMIDLADRIEAAAKQMDVQRIADIARECANVKAECDAENARLKAALKPVLECDTHIIGMDDSSLAEYYEDCINDAQLFYNGDTKQ